MARSGIPTRERIISAANALFYNDGIRGVSVDAVAAKAGVTKRTLYYHFESKDDLVAAYLAGRDQPNLALFKQWFAEADGDLPARIESIFRNLARSARHPKWKGCGFLRTSAELANMPGHPAIKIGAAHKKKFEDWLRATFEAEGITEAAELARQILLLLDGSFAVVLYSWFRPDPENLQGAYGYYFDKNQWDDVANLFTDDATYEIGQRGVYKGRERIRKALDLIGPAGAQPGLLNNELQLQPVIHVSKDGQSAKARWRTLEMKGVHGKSGAWGEGIYENEYLQEDGVWKIRRLHYHPSFLGPYAPGWRNADRSDTVTIVPYHYSPAGAGTPIPLHPVATAACTYMYNNSV